jgi:triphosphoribosyl-dephospho-CoA synthase
MSDDKIKSKWTANPLSRVAEFNVEFRPLSGVPTAIGLACQWEVLAAKPGNVHRLADFADMGLTDFLASALAVAGVALQWLPRWTKSASTAATGPAMAEPAPATFGEFVFDAVQATRQVTSANTNLGICLLLGPLAEAYARLGDESSITREPLIGEPAGERLSAWSLAASRLIERAGVEQTRWLYRAIALASPGGMGQVDHADVHALSSLSPTDTVAHVMGLAAQRDAIAAEYSSGFALTFGQIVPDLAQFYRAGYGLQWATIATFVRRLAREPDSLIVRKAGRVKASEVSTWARQLADHYFPPDAAWAAFEERQEECETAMADLDFALRGDGHRLNPGTTADLLAAGLFVAQIAGLLPLPVRW